MTPSDDQRSAIDRARDAGPEMAGAGLAEIVAHVLGVDWTVSLLAPALTATVRAAREADRRHWRQAAEAVAVAADQLGGADVVRVQALADPARTELLRRVVQAGGRSTLHEKIPALGRVLAAGLPDGDQIDESLILAAALAEIEAPHVQVLALLTRTTAGPSVPDYPGNAVGWRPDEVGDALPGHRLVMPALLSALARHGLIVENGSGTYGGIARWAPTDLGRACLELLRHG